MIPPRPSWILHAAIKSRKYSSEGPEKRSLVSRLLGTDLVLRIVREAKDTRVTIVAQRRRQHQAAAV